MKGGCCTPRLTSVRPNLHALGYTAAHWLDRLMGGQKADFHQLLVPPIQITERSSTDTIASDDKVLVKALRFIRDHAQERIDASMVTEHVGLTRSTVEVRFRNNLGHTIKAEITRVRLSRAKVLLRETRMSLATIAEKCGFATASHFRRVFKNEEGLTPGNYRKHSLSGS